MQTFKNFAKNQVSIEMRQDFSADKNGVQHKFDIDEYMLNHKHSNSEGLPDITDNNSRNELINMSIKEKEHYTFLNNLKTRFNVD